MLGGNQTTSLSQSGNGEENFSFHSENPILENVVAQSNPDFLQLTSSLDFLSQSQPIDIKQLTGGYVEVLGEYNLSTEDVQSNTGLGSQEIKKETLPLPDFQQVWMNQFSQRNSTDQSGESLSGSSDQFSLHQLGENVPYHHSPPSYSANYGVNHSPQYHNQGSSPRQYFAENFPQTSPQFIKTEIPNSSPAGGEVEVRSPEYLTTTTTTTSSSSSSPPGYQHSPQYVWPDQYGGGQQQAEYLSYEPQQSSPGTVTVMVLNEDGTLDKRFTVPNDLLNEALVSSSSPSPPLSSPTSPLDLTAVSSSPFTMPAITNNIMSPVININNSTINMAGQTVDLSAKSNMYSLSNSLSNSNNNAGNLMAALSCLKRPLPRTVLGEQSNHSEHAPQHIIQRAMADFDQGQLSAFENFQQVLEDQKENMMVNFSQERLESLGIIKSVDGSKINTKDKSRASQRGQPYSVNPRKVKTVGSKKSIGAIGQTVHGLKENRQVCPLCKFEATTKNPYRHLQDHLARTHFKERLARELPACKPFNCPIAECESQNLSDWQAVMRHYIGNKHGVLERYVREELDCLRV